MTGDIFKHAIEQASKLSADQQDAIGSLILLELESDARWSQLLNSDPDALRKLGEEAKQEFRDGQTRPIPSDDASTDLAS